ncbi:S1 family peptidase [Micromonospora sp. WMMD1102]|uniref:S1 family peptidase n=1 Tax=Micromonospora sp. WMMD1102 TaxID=3016105 RepID=UPI002414F19D|nr:S1 family peptidase [Micromonospora sp. WMMD1102]MDG4790260.1 S1 family peptidase [Micromonospora sp. WMMD1102]
MRRALTLLTSLTLTASLPVVVVAPAQAATDPGSTGSDAIQVDVPVRPAPTSTGTFQVTGTARSAQALDAEAMQDLTTYAESTGQALSTVVAAHQGIHEFSAYTTKLEETSPDTFVRAGLAAGGAAGNWIQFTAKPSAEVVAELERLPVNTEVQYGAPASSKELADLAYTLVTSLAARSDVIRSAGTRYDYQRRVLRLEYAPVGQSPLRTLSSVFQSALTAGTVGGQLPVEVVLELDANPAAVAERVIEGGRDLNKTNGDSHCTAGFTAVRNGARGVLTARHCDNALRYGNAVGLISTRPASGSNAAVDFQFHRTSTANGHSTNKQFRATNRQAGGDRTVTAVANAPINSAVCHWGRTTGYSCTYVADTDSCRTVSGHRYCGLDRTDRDVSAGGDSGGPWFFGNTARGGHTGAADNVFSLFTRISRVPNHLDASVLRN